MLVSMRAIQDKARSATTSKQTPRWNEFLRRNGCCKLNVSTLAPAGFLNVREINWRFAAVGRRFQKNTSPSVLDIPFIPPDGGTGTQIQTVQPVISAGEDGMDDIDRYVREFVNSQRPASRDSAARNRPAPRDPYDAPSAKPTRYENPYDQRPTPQGRKYEDDFSRGGDFRRQEYGRQRNSDYNEDPYSRGGRPLPRPSGVGRMGEDRRRQSEYDDDDDSDYDSEEDDYEDDRRFRTPGKVRATATRGGRLAPEPPKPLPGPAQPKDGGKDGWWRTGQPVMSAAVVDRANKPQPTAKTVIDSIPTDNAWWQKSNAPPSTPNLPPTPPQSKSGGGSGRAVREAEARAAEVEASKAKEAAAVAEAEAAERERVLKEELESLQHQLAAKNERAASKVDNKASRVDHADANARHHQQQVDELTAKVKLLEQELEHERTRFHTEVERRVSEEKSRAQQEQVVGGAATDAERAKMQEEMDRLRAQVEEEKRRSAIAEEIALEVLQRPQADTQQLELALLDDSMAPADGAAKRRLSSMGVAEAQRMWEHVAAHGATKLSQDQLERIRLHNGSLAAHGMEVIRPTTAMMDLANAFALANLMLRPEEQVQLTQPSEDDGDSDSDDTPVHVLEYDASSRSTTTSSSRIDHEPPE